MPKKGQKELVAGIFVIVGLVLALGVVFWLGSIELFKPPNPQAVFYLDEAAGDAGLKQGIVVKYAGIDIGRIVELRSDVANHRALYVVDLYSADYKLYSNGRSVVSGGFVGDPVLAVVDLGSPAPNSFPAGPEHPLVITGGMGQIMVTVARELDPNLPGSLLFRVKNTVALLEDTAGKASQLAGSVRDELNADANDSLMTRIRKSAAYLQSITTVFNELATLNAPKISKTIDDISQTTGRINEYSRKDIAEILANVRQASTEIVTISKNVSDMSEKLRGVVDRNTLGIDTMIDNLVHVSANLSATSKDVRANPWRLLYKPDEKELKSADIREAARAFSEGAEQLNHAVLKLKTLDTKTVSEEDLKKIREHLQKTFENFTKAEQGLFKELSK